MSGAMGPREFWINPPDIPIDADFRVAHCSRKERSGYVHVREVLPNDEVYNEEKDFTVLQLAKSEAKLKDQLSRARKPLDWEKIWVQLKLDLSTYGYSATETEKHTMIQHLVEQQLKGEE